MNLSEFTIRYLDELRNELLGHGVANRIEYKDVDSSHSIPIEHVGFGDQTAPPGDGTSTDNFDEGSYFINGPRVFLVRDAVIRTQYGMVTVEETAIRESLSFFPWHLFPEFKTTGELYKETSCQVCADEPSVEISDAYSAHRGNDANYYHWLIFFLCRINSTFLDAWATDLRSTPALLLPPFASDVQRDSALAVAEHYRLPVINIPKPVAIKARRLVYAIPMGGSRAHPIIRETLEVLRRKFYRSGDYHPAKIYVSRRDANRRRLANEDEVEALLERRGYAIVKLTGKSFAEQVNLFAHAQKIVGPHGAGLTNFVFSGPRTSILEFQMPSYLNWSHRRLAVALGMRYGFMFGSLLTDAGSHPDLREYHLDIKKLSGTLDQGF